MKTIIVIPKDINENLNSRLEKKERTIRDKQTTIFRKKKNQYQHIQHPGWITTEPAMNGILIATVQSKSEAGDWKLLTAFIGYLDRHFKDKIKSIIIEYE
jgi:hypothetical protein